MQGLVRPSFSLSAPNSAFLEQPPVQLTTSDHGACLGREIIVDPNDRDQPLLGLGSIFTGTDLFALSRLPEDRRDAAMRALFDPLAGAGWSLMRVPFGSTDWEVTPDFFTYDDAPDGVRDWELSRFSIRRDSERGLFRALRRAKEINPALRFHGAVWGIPAWMKDNRSFCYGRFDPECAEVYARYLARTVIAMRDEEGIDLVAVSPQNESLTAWDRATPATCMPWWVQRDVIIAMRREFDRAGLGDVAIWAYDHNYDMSDYFVRPLLDDAEARAAIGGIAYHDYGGEPEIMGNLHREMPDLPLYATERTVLGVDGMARILRQLRAGARCYNQWTTASDEWGGPHQFLGTPFLYEGAPRPESSRNFVWVKRDDPSDFGLSPAWGLYGQFTRHLRPGMVRVACTAGDDDWVRAVSFIDDASGEIALVTVNATSSAQSFTLRCGGQSADLEQPVHSVASWRFTPAADNVTLAVTDGPDRAPYPEGWDVVAEELRGEGECRAGSDLLLSCVVRNAGGGKVPPYATLRVNFTLDGDMPIARAYVPLPSLAPGETVEARANVPFGMPYENRVAWRAEKGHHQIFARVCVGNVRPNKCSRRAVIAREFDFE